MLWYVVLMSTTNCEKESLPGQTVLRPQPLTFFKKEVFLCPPFNLVQEITDIKFGENFLDNFKRKELNVMLRNVCTS